MCEYSSGRSSAQSGQTSSSTSPPSTSSQAIANLNSPGHIAAIVSRRRLSSDYVSPYPPLTPPSAPSSTSAMANVRHPRHQRSGSVSTSSTSSSYGGNVSTAGNDGSAVSSQVRRARQDAKDMSTTQKLALIEALNEHRINTIGELRRIERIFAEIGTSDVTQPMTAAWTYYVNSHSLLTELRGLTKNFPFSSECLDEGKTRVHQDPASNRSWNYCWLVLAKVHADALIPLYARQQAARPEMWNGRRPSEQDIQRLAQAFIQEWTLALRQLLRYWESAPIR